ncbi:MAG: hypothetical protein ABIR59_08460 [Gemmatimonadales bacterium]
MTGPRDWDKEMADIDKMISANPAPASGSSASPGSVPARTSGVPASVQAPRATTPIARVTRPRDTLGVWLKTVLGALGFAALMVWPYGTACGTPLYGFLTGATAVAASGIWTMGSAWKHRRGLAHIVGVFILLGGLALIGSEILPRIGYAAVAKTWTCN